MANVRRLRDFVKGMTQLVDAAAGDELRLLREGGGLLGELIAVDDWLPHGFARQHAQHHQEYLLHCDPAERFSVVCVVLAPSQRMPVHDHLTWCLSGVLRGLQHFEEYRVAGEGLPLVRTGAHFAPVGEIEAVSPTIGDIHSISNPRVDGATVSIHVFGTNIGMQRRHCFSLATSEKREYVSGYANDLLPNLWCDSTARQPGGVAGTSAVEWSAE